MYKNVTQLSELPELSDLEGIGRSPQGDGYRPHGDSFRPQGEGYNMADMIPPDAKVQKFIRPKYQAFQEAGMDQQFPPQNQGLPPQEMQMQQQAPALLDPLHEISCLNIAKHVSDCPICSKFYSNDKSIYIIIIVLLTIICLLLLKKVLNI